MVVGDLDLKEVEGTLKVSPLKIRKSEHSPKQKKKTLIKRLNADLFNSNAPHLSMEGFKMRSHL